MSLPSLNADPNAILLSPATQADIPSLVKIHCDAHRANLATMLMFGMERQQLEKAMAEALEMMLRRRRREGEREGEWEFEVVKATLSVSGPIVGLAALKRSGFEQQSGGEEQIRGHEGEEEQSEVDDEERAKRATATNAEKGITQVEAEVHASSTTDDEAGAHHHHPRHSSHTANEPPATSARRHGNTETPTLAAPPPDLRTWMRQFIEHSRAAHLTSHSMTRHIYINALSVDPVHRGRGIGAALVRWVEQQADAVSVPCWALSTPAAVGLYKRCGWTVKEETVVELDDWLPREAGRKGRRESGWGRYVYTCLLRMPGQRERVWDRKGTK